MQVNPAVLDLCARACERARGACEPRSESGFVAPGFLGRPLTSLRCESSTGPDGALCTQGTLARKPSGVGTSDSAGSTPHSLSRPALLLSPRSRSCSLASLPLLRTSTAALCFRDDRPARPCTRRPRCAPGPLRSLGRQASAPGAVWRCRRGRPGHQQALRRRVRAVRPRTSSLRTSGRAS